MKKIYKIDAPLDLAYNHVAAVLKKRCPLDKKQYDGLSFENSLSGKKFRTAYMFQKRASKEQLLSGGKSKEVADYENTKTSLKSYVDYCFYRGDSDGKETTVVANFQNNRNKIEFFDMFVALCPLLPFVVGLLASVALSEGSSILAEPLLYISFILSAAFEVLAIDAKRRREPPFDPAERLERLVDEAFAEIEECKCIEVQK